MVTEEVTKEDTEIIAMGYDLLFKKMFGDNYDTDKAAALISIFLDIPYKDIKGNVYVHNNEIETKNKNNKKQEVDVLLHVILKSGNQYVNLEANLFNYSQNLINRNVGYLNNVFSNQLEKSEDYDLLEPVIQINFNVPDKEHKNKDPYHVIDEYLLRNEQGEVLTNMERIISVDIVKCYNLWYNGDMRKFDSHLKTIIKIGALHYIQKDEEFRKCLGEIDMDNEVKTKIQSDMDEYQNDKSLAMAYDYEKHINSLRRTKDRELEEKEKRINNYEQEVKDYEQKVNEQEQKVNAHEKMVKEFENKVKEQDKMVRKQQEEIIVQQRKLKQEKNKIVKNLLSINMDIEEIAKLTDLSIDEISGIDD